jgi:hypothetical protein
LASRARKWWVFDCETDKFVHGRVPEPFAWVVYNESEYLQWWGDESTDEFVAWAKQQDAVLFAHNGGKFDFAFLIDHLEGEVVYIDGRIVKVQMGRAELRDSYSLIPVALGEFARGKKLHDFDTHERERRERFRAAILDYCLEDCRTLYRLLVAFFAENKGMPLTLPSAAMKAFSKIEDVKVPEGTEHYDADFRQWYFGGRVQAISPGTHRGDFAIYDLNSAYPHAMASKRHWWGFAWRSATELPPGERLAACLATIRARSTGAFPVRGKRLEYPADGEIRVFSVTGHEIIAAMQTGTLEIVEVLQVREPLETIDFAAYVDLYWCKKDEAERAGDKEARHTAKIMMNGLYGKFAQDASRFCDFAFPNGPDDALWKRSLEPGGRRVEIAHRWLLGIPARRPHWYNVATAASITGAVRATLWRALCGARRPLYCDTDCVIVERPGESMELGEGLGQWKREARLQEIHIAGRKMYAAKLHAKDPKAGDTDVEFPGWKVASKGCRLTPAQIRAVSEGDTVTWRSDAPQMLRATRLPAGRRFVERRIRRT